MTDLPRLYLTGRKSDKWLGPMLLILHLFMAVFIVYTSYQQGQAERAREETVIAREKAEQDRARLNQIVAEQNKLLVCFATDTQQFQLALSNALLAVPPRPEIEEEYKKLSEIRDRLAASDRATKANPPACTY